ncbi:glycosyltransferase family 32 protein [Candidatus Dependentiae bacterium]
MKKKVAIIFYLMLLSSFNFYADQRSDEKIGESSWRFADFDLSMGKGNGYYEKFFREKSHKYPSMQFPGVDYKYKMSYLEIMDFLRELFNKNNLSVKVKNPRMQIPKTIHQVWLGGPLPERYNMLIKTWIEKHPDWQYRLWTDEDAAEFDMVNREIFENSTNYAEKADIFRYEILYKFGGLYVDIDFECYEPFDIFNENYEFYTGLSPVTHSIYLANGLIGSVPGHPIIEYCVKEMKGHVKRLLQRGRRDNQGGVCDRTGPQYFTKAFFDVLVEHMSTGLYDHTIALPSGYLYPITFRACDKKLKGEKLKQHLKRYPEAIAIHYWHANWWGKKIKGKK